MLARHQVGSLISTMESATIIVNSGWSNILNGVGLLYHVDVQILHADNRLDVPLQSIQFPQPARFGQKRLLFEHVYPLKHVVYY
jgi:hypothetical protein